MFAPPACLGDSKFSGSASGKIIPSFTDDHLMKIDEIRPIKIGFVFYVFCLPKISFFVDPSRGLQLARAVTYTTWNWWIFRFPWQFLRGSLSWIFVQAMPWGHEQRGWLGHDAFEWDRMQPLGMLGCGTCGKGWLLFFVRGSFHSLGDLHPATG